MGAAAVSGCARPAYLGNGCAIFSSATRKESLSHAANHPPPVLSWKLLLPVRRAARAGGHFTPRSRIPLPALHRPAACRPRAPCAGADYRARHRRAGASSPFATARQRATAAIGARRLSAALARFRERTHTDGLLRGAHSSRYSLPTPCPPRPEVRATSRQPMMTAFT